MALKKPIEPLFSMQEEGGTSKKCQIQEHFGGSFLLFCRSTLALKPVHFGETLHLYKLSW